MGHATRVLMHGGLIFGLGRSIVGCFDFTIQTTNKSETRPPGGRNRPIGTVLVSIPPQGTPWDALWLLLYL